MLQNILHKYWVFAYSVNFNLHTNIFEQNWTIYSKVSECLILYTLQSGGYHLGCCRENATKMSFFEKNVLGRQWRSINGEWKTCWLGVIWSNIKAKHENFSFYQSGKLSGICRRFCTKGIYGRIKYLIRNRVVCLCFVPLLNHMIIPWYPKFSLKHRLI